MVMLWLLFILIGVSEASVKVKEIDSSTVNLTSCIPVEKLDNFIVQRGLGESRKIRRIHIQIIGSGYIDLDLSIATTFRDGDYNSPVFHRCGNYLGKIEDVEVSSDCMDTDHAEGYDGYAVYARFHGNDIDHSLMVCRMDIILHDKKDAQRKDIIRGTIVITSVICIVIILSGVGVFAWYNWVERKENGGELVTAFEEFPDGSDKPQIYEEVNFTIPTGSLEQVEELEKPRSEIVDDVFYDPSETSSRVNLRSIETYID